jgi:transposase
MNRTVAARIDRMDRQTLRDWVHAFNSSVVDGLIKGKAPGREPNLSAAQTAVVKEIVLKGLDPEKDGVVRWRRVDLERIAKARFDVSVDEDTKGRLLRRLGFSHASAPSAHCSRLFATQCSVTNISPSHG